MREKTKNMYKAVVAFAVAMAFVMPGVAVSAYLEKNSTSLIVDDASINLQSLEKDTVSETTKNSKSADVPYSAAVTIPEDPTKQDYWVSPEQTRAARNTVLREYGISEEKILAMTDEEAMNLRNSLTTSQLRTNVGFREPLDIDWWPEDGHDLMNSAYTTSTAPDLYNGTLLWKKKVIGEGMEGCSPVVDNKVIVSSRDHPPIYCLNATTGAEIWNYSGTLYSSPAIVNGKVYATVNIGIVCLDFNTGALQWVTPIGFATAGPAVYNNRVFFGGFNAAGYDTFYCLRTLDGTELWNVSFGTPQYNWGLVYGSPAIANDKVYFGYGQFMQGNVHKLFCYSINGNHIWNVTTPGQSGGDTSPAVIGDRVYISAGDFSGSHALCYNATTGNLIWDHCAEDAFGYKGLAVANGFVYTKELLTLYCLYANNGTEKWSYNYQEYGGCNGGGPSVTADGKVYVQKDTSPDGTPILVCLDAYTGAYLGGFVQDFGEIRGTPVVANGRIYAVGYDSGYLYCIGEVDHDIITVSIDSPVSGPEPGTFTPEVTVKNQGRSDETNVPVTMKITNIYRYLYEDFTSTVWPPAGWTEEQANEWKQNTNQCVGAPPDAILNPLWGMQGTLAYLQSPAADTSTATALILEFKCKIQGFVPNMASAYVYIRADSSQPWTDVAPWPNPLNGQSYGPSTFQVDITPYIGSGTQVRFEYNGAPFGAIAWQIDDVSVLTPPAETPEYNETVYVDILSKDTASATFPEWTPSGLYYIVEAETELATDEVTWNDAIQEVITFHYYNDLAVLGIDTPESGHAAVITPEVQVANFGSFNMTDQSVNLKIGEPQPTFLEEDFSGSVFPPAGWTEEQAGEWISTGGEVPEALTYSSLISGNYTYLQSAPVDTTAVSELTLEFESCIYDNSGGYDCSVLVRKDAMHLWVDETPWSNPITGNVGPDTYTIDITPYIGTGTQVRFEFDGNASNFSAWFIDDVTILNVIPLEYDETVLINISTEEVITVVFPDWTPEYLTYDYSGSIDYEVTVCTSVADDEFPNNDCLTELITLEFIHDMGVKTIAEPVWEYFHNGYDNNGVGLTNGGTFEAAMRLTPDELQYYDNGEITAVKFYHHETGTHSGNIKIYGEGTSGSAGPLITSEPYTVTGKGWYEVTLSSPVTINAEEDLWVSVEITHNAGQYPMGIDSGPAVDGKGDWIYINGGWEEIQSNIDNNWCIEAQIKENVEWTPGTYPIDAVIANYGTYNESDFNVNAKIWLILGKDWILYYESNSMITTVMQPGVELDAVFNDAVFGIDDIGDYRLEITTELTGDDNPSNDQGVLLFKVVLPPDVTPPVTTATVAGTMGQNNWYVSNVTVTLTATDPDGTGVSHTYYKVDSGAYAEYTVPIVVTADGQHTVSYYSDDNAGNVEDPAKTVSFKMDTTKPEWINYTCTALNLLKTKWLCVANVTDETSGVVLVQFFIDEALVGNDTQAPYEFQYLGKATNNSQGLAYDEAGNSALSPLFVNYEYGSQQQSYPQLIQTLSEIVTQQIQHQQEQQSQSQLVTQKISALTPRTKE